MNRNLCVAAFAVGLAVVGWVGIAYVGSGPLALTMTLLIGAFYLMGGLELRAFHQATTRLQAALAALPEHGLASLGPWLQQLPPALQNPVRLRIEGERVGLPGPVMTPYLVGLLVLLGMLGTFLGMVVTLNGAVMALESTTDLPTIRAALAAPVKGLGLAFGTSVAGVAASAMLGLVSALCRRERLFAAQGLDTHIATHLHAHTLAHQRQATLAALQLQARVMPEVVAQMQAMLAQMERHSERLNAGLLAGQEHFHGQARAAYAGLAASVDRSLKDSLSESARLAGAALQPVAEATMRGIASETAAFQARMADTVQRQLDGLSQRFDTAVAGVAERWAQALEQHERSNEALTDRCAQQSAALLATVDSAHSTRQAEAAAADGQRLAAWTQTLQAMAAALQSEWQQAGAQAQGQQAQICQTLEHTAQALQAQAAGHARDTLAQMSRLIETASEAPRAAAEVIGRLREQLSDSLARDNGLLEERSRTMATLGTLLDAVNLAATEQRGAIDALVQSSAAVLQQTGAQFSDRVEAEATNLAAVAAQLTGSAVEVASLGEAFGAAVQLFSASSEAMTLQLQRIEGALGKSTARSDEQLAYYVAQAREIIDLSISSQKQIVEDLQQLAGRPLPLATEPA
ncbi:MAG: DUF802 domain-containing protein [Rubrivivax sp.]|nr:DUF802 domain-containing protein [Rubrivivax sp.]